MNPYFRKLFKIVKISSLVLVLVFFGLWLLIRVPKVQTWLVQQVTQSLSETLQTKVSVKKVDIAFFKTAMLEGIYIEDLRADTLLFAEKLKANIGIFSLFNKTIFLNEIGLDGAVINLLKKEEDSLYNFEFITKAFSGNAAETDVKKSAKPWDFGIGNVSIKNTRFNMADETEGGFVLKTIAGKLAVKAKSLDFEKQKIALSELALERSSVDFTILQNDKPPPTDTSALRFPAFGWNISADDLNLENSQFKFSNLNYERQENIVDYNFLNLENTSLKISNINLDESSITGQIHQASMADHSGFRLNNLSGDIVMNNESITAQKLRLETPKSSLNSDIRLIFSDFSDLYAFMEKVRLEADFSGSSLAYRDLNMLVPVVKSLPVVNTGIDEIISLDGRIVLENNRIIFEAFESSIGSLFVLDATGSVSNLAEAPYFDLRVKEMLTDHNSLTKLLKNSGMPEGLNAFGKIGFSGKLKGPVGQFSGTDLRLTTESATQFAGNLQISGLPDIKKIHFTADVETLTTQAADIRAIAGDQVPRQLDSLGVINFKGELEGTTTDFAVNGDLRTAAGQLSANLEADFENDYKNASYEGSIETENFNLAKILGSSFGLTRLKVDAKGSGLDIGTLDIRIEGEIPLFSYNDYAYNDLSLNGAFFKKRFEGTAGSKDENIRFDFQGMIDLNDSLPDFQMALDVDTINLEALNFYNKKLGFSGALEADLKGDKFDNINGTAQLTKFHITQDSIHYSAQQTIKLEAGTTPTGAKSLTLRSGFLDAGISGNFNIAKFPKSVMEFINGFFPIENLVGNDSLALAPEQDVDFDFKFKEIAPFAQLFLPDFSAADTAFIKGHFNSVSKQLNLEGAFPKLVYDGLSVDTILLGSTGTPQHFETGVNFKNVKTGNAMNFPNLAFSTLFKDDTLHFGLNIRDDKTEEHPEIQDSIIHITDNIFDLEGKVSHIEENYVLSFSPSLVLNNENWKIDTSNQLEFDNKNLFVRQLNIFKDDQEIAITSQGAAPENDFSPVHIRLSSFNLEEISKMLGLEAIRLGGRANGELVLKEPKTNLHYNSAIKVSDLTYNDNLVGDLDIKAKQPGQEQVVEMAIRLEGQYQMSITGDYAISNNIFDLDFRLGKLPVFLVDPFLQGILERSEGFLSGDLKLTGTPDQPLVDGKVNLNDFGTTVVISNSRYRAEESVIRISEKNIDLGAIKLKDAGNNSAVLGGKILHNYLRNFRFDLNFDTDAFRFLNTTMADNELYYGDLFLKASVTVKGTPGLPIISIDATTLPKSRLFVQPFIDSDGVQQEDYIIYANPEQYNEDSLRLAEQKIGGNRTSYDLTLNLEVTKDASLYIVIDPATGDQLISTGSANLTVNINPAGVLTVAGNYTIEKGRYSLNYEQLVKRDFEIEKGSSIVFAGDPMNAGFDVAANYKVRASTYELLSSQATLSDSEKNEARLRTDVVVRMKLRGNINAPDISFDILIPGMQSEGIGSAVNRKLAELRRNPEELNKQAFGLLLFKSFIAESGNSAHTLSETGTAIALSSVSSLMADQLNRFANRYVKGFEVDIGVESYNISGAESMNITKMELNVSKQLFQDRLTVNVGTNVNLGAEGSGSGENYSGIAGDFVIEYQLTKSGNYRIKVFHTSDFNVLEQNNAYNTGAGIIFRKSFNRKKYKE